MTDPNQPPVTPPSNNPPPAYGQPAAPDFGQAPAYGAPAYGAPVYGAPAPQPYGAPPTGSDKYNVLAIVSLVSAFFISLVAVITGHIALSQIKKTGEKGRGLAIGGLVLGYAGIAAGIIALAILIPLYLAILSDPSFQNELNNY
ncbi:DUF4190 domain-containing protein [Cryobacterium melibiosiphilum]|uniref:DUF4190 domain-containing protein n=1 Tax=Cryobacterium melibiosiphilum TaxID=995039 RepID=A0A3A5MMC6_9MICO|nr:DUF4190 domain-containing protein [Cryobacterium melibiosiphilum]RJT90522.1 DUF4190 domain-containing protein [Cryobacterium melibiosiphilum]